MGGSVAGALVVVGTSVVDDVDGSATGGSVASVDGGSVTSGAVSPPSSPPEHAAIANAAANIIAPRMNDRE
ncbi:MAG: hypothetical protein WD225_08660 [Ilumatobacteraceae bacterium]